MKSRSDWNNRGIVLLQSNCIAGACQVLEEAAAAPNTTDTARPRRTTTEALPHRSAHSTSFHVIDFSVVEQSVDAKSLLLLMHQASIVLIRLPRACPFTAAVIPYNNAMAQLALAATCVLNTIKADECRDEAKVWLEQSQQKLQKWCTGLVHKSSSAVKQQQQSSPGDNNTNENDSKLPELLRTAVLLQLWVSVTLCRLSPSQERHDEIQQIQLFLLNHDQRQRLQQSMRIRPPPNVASLTTTNKARATTNNNTKVVTEPSAK